MSERRIPVRMLVALACAALLVAAVPAAARPFRPRIGGALGLLPHRGALSPSEAATIPLVYHGGTVMHGVTVHALFWAPPGHPFSGAPSETTGGYVSLVNQFLGDVANDSASGANIFSLLGQYPDRTGSGAYHVSFAAGVDAIEDGAPYPEGGHGCVSPGGAAVCVTDAALQAEIARVIHTSAPAATGLHDVWMIFLPPGVDTCISSGSCATSAFAGYHSVFDTAAGPVIYAAIPEPTLEFVPPPGSDPQGNPTAESAIDTVAHELMEAMTDPEGAGWMDPNGFEVGDRCETGPQIGTPIGYAPDGSPYNQVIAAHQYLIQAMWSNQEFGCVDRSSKTAAGIVLPAVNLTQYSAVLTGRDPAGQSGRLVQALLLRGGDSAGLASTRTGAGGAWRLVLRGPDGRPISVGDDREDLLVSMDKRDLVIQTGEGGNPFSASGWTGWFDLDHGFAVGRRAVAIAPCSQVGVLTLRRNGQSQGAPLDQCSTATDVAIVPTGPLDGGTRLTLDSDDNRASSILDPAGALVNLRVALGEPGAVDGIGNPLVPLETTGTSACSVDLYRQQARCAGLVPGERYTLSLGRRSARARAGEAGTAVFPPQLGPLRGGGQLTLRGSGHRVLTVLHVAHLRVDLSANRQVAVSGRCEPGEFVGAPLTAPPTTAAAGAPGPDALARACPRSGRAAGLPAGDFEQTDDRSGGTTRTEVPQITGTAPTQDATLYGAFRAVAQTTGSGHDRVTLRIIRAASHRTVFTARDAHAPFGSPVPALRRGTYVAIWVLHDPNGDTRTLRTAFVAA